MLSRTLSWFSQKRCAFSRSGAEIAEVGRNIFCIAVHCSVKSAFFIVYLHLNDRNACGLLSFSGGAFEMKAIGAPLMDHRPPRSSYRANGHSLSRHRFAWCPFQRRQLQDGGVLTLAQLRDQDNFPIGKLKRVVMHGWLV